MKAVNIKLFLSITISNSKENCLLPLAVRMHGSNWHCRFYIHRLHVWIHPCVAQAIVPSVGVCLLRWPMIAKMLCHSTGTLVVFFTMFLSKDQIHKKEIQQAKLYKVTKQGKQLSYQSQHFMYFCYSQTADSCWISELLEIADM